jgi:hypothetical protein
MLTPTAFARSAAHDGSRCVENPQRRSRMSPLHRANGVLTTAATATTIAAYAGVRTHHASEPGSSAPPAPLHTSAASKLASIATPAIPVQYKGRW